MSEPEVTRTPATYPRLAIVHEKFTVDAGAERCVEALHEVWPEAPIFTTVCDPSVLAPGLRDADIRTSPWLQRLYPGGDRYAHLLPLLAPALAHHDLSEFDVVITSHHAFANRIRVRPETRVVAYTHTPARWIWDPTMRVHEVGGPVGRAGLAAYAATQRAPDRRAAARLDAIAANSHEVAWRIRRWWGRASEVIAPPVDVDFFTPDERTTKRDSYLLAGRLVPYKRPEVAVAAATRAGVRLVVAGTGRAMDRCRAVAGPTIEFVSDVTREELRTHYRRARALLYPGVEDFGIMPVEAQACGTPVIALDLGGARDTVVDGVTGIRYAAGNDPVASLAHHLQTFDDAGFDAKQIRCHAEQFSVPRFRAQLHDLVTRTIERG
jgi:glycosyltransferase involved in cell wall biosynthesis